MTPEAAEPRARVLFLSHKVTKLKLNFYFTRFGSFYVNKLSEFVARLHQMKKRGRFPSSFPARTANQSTTDWLKPAANWLKVLSEKFWKQ